MNQNDNEMLDISDWAWSDFKLVFDTLAPTWGVESAWKVIHVIWKMRAGEEITPEEAKVVPSIDMSVNEVIMS